MMKIKYPSKRKNIKNTHKKISEMNNRFVSRYLSENYRNLKERQSSFLVNFLLYWSSID